MAETFSQRIDGIVQLADLSPRRLSTGDETLLAQRRRELAIALDRNSGVDKAQEALHGFYAQAGTITNPLNGNLLSAEQAMEGDAGKLAKAAKNYIEDYEALGGYRGYNDYPNVKSR